MNTTTYMKFKHLAMS